MEVSHSADRSLLLGAIVEVEDTDVECFMQRIASALISKFLFHLQFGNMYVYACSFLSEEELATPPLNGIILPGVTRQSILEITRKWVGDH